MIGSVAAQRSAYPLREALTPLAGCFAAAFVSGSVAKGTDNGNCDIGLMLVSDDLTYDDAFGSREAAIGVLGRAVNPMILTSQEFRKRLAANKSCLTRVLEQPRMSIIGAEDALAIGGATQESVHFPHGRYSYVPDGDGRAKRHSCISVSARPGSEPVVCQ